MKIYFVFIVLVAIHFERCRGSYLLYGGFLDPLNLGFPSGITYNTTNNNTVIIAENFFVESSLKNYTLQSVTFWGFYTQTIMIQSWTLRVYDTMEQSSTCEGEIPGTVIYNEVFPPTSEAGDWQNGIPTLNLSSPLSLSSGKRYWVSIFPTSTPITSNWFVYIFNSSTIRGAPAALYDDFSSLTGESYGFEWLPTVCVTDLTQEPDFEFAIYGTVIDITPPVLNALNYQFLISGIVIPSTTISNNSTVLAYFFLNITDDLYFTTGFMIISKPDESTFQIGINSSSLYSGFPENGIFEVSFEIPEGAPTGEWQISKIVIYDESQNNATYLNYFSWEVSNNSAIGTTGTAGTAGTTGTTGTAGTTGSIGTTELSNVSIQSTPIDIGAIIGGIVAGFFVLIFIAIILLFFVYRKKKYNNKTEMNIETTVQPKLPQEPSINFYENSTSPKTEPMHYKVIPHIAEFSKENDDSFLIDFNELEMEKEIGRGAYGVVYKGRWRGGIVAIKQLLFQGVVSQKELEDFRDEAALMKKLRPHVNVVQFLGITVSPSPLCIITEFLDQGSLLNYINSDCKIDPNFLMVVVKGIAAGMLHLHCEGIVHRDLATRNILLGSGFQVKISDFGLSRVSQNTKQSNTTKSDTGPLKWMPPEAIRKRQYSRASDVWSFGVTLWEIICRSEPYPDLDPVQAALEVSSGTKLTIPSFCPPILAQIMESCFETEPEKRPDFDLILKTFQNSNLEQWNFEPPKKFPINVANRQSYLNSPIKEEKSGNPNSSYSEFKSPVSSQQQRPQPPGRPQPIHYGILPAPNNQQL